jgi:hypothetical protein
VGQTINQEERSTMHHTENQARRAAERVGVLAHKSSCRVGGYDNLGAFQVIDPLRNTPLQGGRLYRRDRTSKARG